MKRRIVITGIGAISPLGCEVETIWGRLVSGVGGVVPITRFDASAHSVKIAAQVRDWNADAFIDPKAQRRMDIYCQYAIAAARLAVKDSGLDFSTTDPERNGCLVSSGIGGLTTMREQIQVIIEKGPGRVSPFTIPSLIPNMGAGLVAIEHNLKGPNYGIVSACAAGLHALGAATRFIERGDADIMVCGGSECVLCDVGVAGFANMRALSTRNDSPETACRPFDKDRDGFIMGEGAAVLVLEEYEAAKARGATIYCEVAGFGMTCDAFHITAPPESGEGSTRAMRLALKDAGLSPADVDYINAHGTSTPLNDKIETIAIKAALGEADARRVAISSTKSMTGHLLGAAGAFESMVCALALQRGVIPPTINYVTPDPDCDLDYVPNTARETTVKVALNNSLGFGGHNACAAFTKI